MAKKQGEYISGEEHLARQANYPLPPQPGKRLTMPLIPVIIIAIVLAGLGFAGGMAYQKGHNKTVSTTASSANGGLGGGGRGGFRRRAGGLGQVTAVSSSSITINNQRTGASNTYTINNATAISDNGQTVGVSDIQAGDTVLVTTSGSGSTTATRILVNPNFGEGGGSSSGSSQVE